MHQAGEDLGGVASAGLLRVVHVGRAMQREHGVLAGREPEAFDRLLECYEVTEVVSNRDYEPAAVKRDAEVAAFLEESHHELGSKLADVIDGELGSLPVATEDDAARAQAPQVADDGIVTVFWTPL